MAIHARTIRFHGLADLGAAAALGIAALIAHHQSTQGKFFSSGDGSVSIDLGPPLVLILVALTVAFFVRGLVLLIGEAKLAASGE